MQAHTLLTEIVHLRVGLIQLWQFLGWLYSCRLLLLLLFGQVVDK